MVLRVLYVLQGPPLPWSSGCCICCMSHPTMVLKVLYVLHVSHNPRWYRCCMCCMSLITTMVGRLPVLHVPHTYHGREAVCAACLTYPPWEEGLVYAQRYPSLTHGRRTWSMRRGLFSHHMGREPGLCAETSSHPWEESLVYAQKPLLFMGGGPGLCAEASPLLGSQGGI